MKAKKKICPSCGKEGYMWTRKYGCKACSSKKDKKPIKKRAKAIKRISKKQARSNKAVQLAKLRVMQEWIQAHGRVYCSSCGTNQGFIDFSHVVPISDNKKLEGEHEIIFPQCRENCHALTERGDKGMKDFINYSEIMAVIKRHDPDYYRKLFVKHNT